MGSFRGRGRGRGRGRDRVRFWLGPSTRLDPYKFISYYIIFLGGNPGH